VTVTFDPGYTEEAREANFSGSVEVGVTVDENGRPSNIRVVRGVGMGLDEEAVEAVRHYRFKLATRGGKPMSMNIQVEVDFHP